MSERFGDWILDELIAVGGLAEVWRATHVTSERAALKRLHSHIVRNDEAMRQFAVERRLAEELPPHPAVVRIARSEPPSVEGRPYLALTLAPGADLRRSVEGGPATRVRALAIATAACGAVSHLHAHGWVHGDVNPSNLIVDSADRLMLVDLGIARPIGEGGPARGTHAYMAPEQVRGEAWTPATDVFALGVVLWELAAGKRLFHRGPPWLSMAAVVEQEAPPLGDARLDEVLAAALAKDPRARIQSADDLASRLGGD